MSTPGGGRLSYAELDTRAGRLAGRLIEQGVRPEQRVAILMERSADLVVAVLAVLKAGGAYLPLDLRAPVARLSRTLSEARAAVRSPTAMAIASSSSSRSGGIAVPARSR